MKRMVAIPMILCLTACAGGQLHKESSGEASAPAAKQSTKMSPQIHEALMELWKDKPEYHPLIGAEPPVRPIRVVSTSAPRSPGFAIKEIKAVRVSFIVAPDGQVEAARIFSSDDQRLNEYAIEAIYRFKFSAAQGVSGPERGIGTMPFYFGGRN